LPRVSHDPKTAHANLRLIVQRMTAPSRSSGSPRRRARTVQFTLDDPRFVQAVDAPPRQDATRSIRNRP
jgi:hypothetical protein